MCVGAGRRVHTRVGHIRPDAPRSVLMASEYHEVMRQECGAVELPLETYSNT